MIDRLFTFNQSTFLVELNKEWISTIKEFRTILVRDRGSKGDVQGRKKFQAQKEFTFIYHYCDYRSQFINYSEKDRLTEALKNAELDPKMDIYKDEELIAAVEVYKALQETPALKLLTELKEGIHTAHKVVKRIREDLNTKLDNFDTEPVEVGTDFKGKPVVVDPIKRIEERLDTIMKIANKLPDTLASIEKQEEKVKKELADAPNMRGKADKGIREDAPNTGSSGGLVISSPFGKK